MWIPPWYEFRELVEITAITRPGPELHQVPGRAHSRPAGPSGPSSVSTSGPGRSAAGLPLPPPCAGTAPPVPDPAPEAVRCAGPGPIQPHADALAGRLHLVVPLGQHRPPEEVGGGAAIPGVDLLPWPSTPPKTRCSSPSGPQCSSSPCAPNRCCRHGGPEAQVGREGQQPANTPYQRRPSDDRRRCRFFTTYPTQKLAAACPTAVMARGKATKPTLTPWVAIKYAAKKLTLPQNIMRRLSSSDSSQVESAMPDGTLRSSQAGSGQHRPRRRFRRQWPVAGDSPTTAPPL